MTTLAQKYIDICDEMGMSDNRLVQQLRPQPGASVLEISHTVAERYVFECYPHEVIAQQINAKKLKAEDISVNARMPCSTMWMEWLLLKDDPSVARAGAMLNCMEDKEGSFMVIYYIVEMRDGKVYPWMTARVPIFPQKGPSVPMQIAWSKYGEEGASREDVVDESQQCINDVVSGLFLLSVPRVCSEERVSPPRHERRRREREGLPPEIEFRRVKVHVGQAPPRYRGHDSAKGDSDREIVRRKLHRVESHFRSYTKERDAPLISFVPEHWRGDAKLGIVLHERVIKNDNPSKDA